MAGQGDSPNTPEKATADSLITHQSATTHTDNLQEYRQSNPPGNADKPGAPEAHKNAQDGGAQPPPEQAAAAPKDGKDGTDKAAAPEAIGPTPKALDVMHQVNAILDGDVPKFNKAHDLESAKQAYEKAIAVAKTLTPEDIAKAQKDLVEVRKEKAAEKDPAKQRDLANKEADLYTITRLKDAALGNEALWYYRQGKTADGNEKLLEASGIPDDQAHAMRNLTDADLQKFGAALNQAADSKSVAPILGDVNFYRQLNKIKEGGSPVPEVFGKIHEAVLQLNKDSAQPSDASRTTDNTNAAAPVDAKKIQGDIDAFKALSQQLGDKGGPLSAEQRATLETGLKAFDSKNQIIGKLMDDSQKVLDGLMPRDKQQAYANADTAVQAELKKIGDPKTGAIPDDVKKNIISLVNGKTPAEYEAAKAALNKTNPNLVKAVEAETALLPTDKKAGAQFLQAWQNNQNLQSDFVNASLEQSVAHCNYAKLLTQTKTPPDAADMAHAKEVMSSAFNNVPAQVKDTVLADKDIQKLGMELGVLEQLKNPTVAGADQGTRVGDSTAGTAPGAAKTSLDDMPIAELQTKLAAAIKKGAAGMTEAKALYEQEIKRAENPEMIAAATKAVQDNLKALADGKDADGKPLDAQGRLARHQNNVEMVGLLSASAQLHAEYALYLGDNRLNLADPANAHAKLDGGLNQIKSMDAQQRLAIAAADKVDLNMLKQVDAAINNDRKAGVGGADGSKALNDLKVVMEGGKDSTGGEQPGLMGTRVAYRDQLAALYLTQGVQFRPDGSAMGQIMPKDHQTDELFKPQYALQLLTDAKKANEDINGKGSHNETTDTLFAMGQSLQPDIFKNNSDRLRATGANAVSDMAALGTSVAGGMAMRFALGVATEGRINPMAAGAIANLTAVGTGIVTRHLVHDAITGKTESWADSAVHGTAAALMPIGFKYTSEALASGKLGAMMNWRSAGLTTENVLERAGSTIGKDATFAQTAQVFRNSGLKTEATALEAYGSRPLSSATAEEMTSINNALNLNGARGREAMVKLFPNLNTAAQEAKVVDALHARGITSAADLDAQLQARADKVVSLNEQVQTASLKGIKDSSPVSDALKRMTGADSKPLYASQEAIDRETKFLAENDIKTVGQLRNAGNNARDYFTVKNLFPELANVPASTIREAAAGGNILGEANSAGRVQLKNIVPEAHPVSDRATAVLHGLANKANSAGGYIKDVLWDDRVWRVQFHGSPVSFAGAEAKSGLVAAEGDAAQTGLRGVAQRFTPSFNRPSMPNLERLDPRFSSPETFKAASAQTKFGTAAAASLLPIAGYNTITGEYDNWYKGTQYQDEKGEWHQYSFVDALEDANLGARGENMAMRLATGTIGQALVGGFFLKGAVAPVLEEAAPAVKSAPGYFSSKIPALGRLSDGIANSGRMIAGREAVSGGGALLKGMGTYAVFGNGGVYQGVTNLMDAHDKQKTYDSTQAPLVDYAPDDIGSTADQVNANQAAAPTDTSGSAPVTSTDAAPAPVPVPSGDGASTAAPPPDSTQARPAAPVAAPAPAAAPAPKKDDIGANLAPPGQ
ncbi:MAG: hypothetical protein KGS72_07215 [Cyanobacteria bacterium REEB67]|nr:hypothetical protein [Cyanobacteria bacterium REEB67]